MARANGTQGPGPRAAGIAMLGALELGHQHGDALGRGLDEGFQRLAGAGKFRGVDRGTCDRQRTLDMAGHLRRQGLDPDQPLPRRIAEPDMGVGIGEIGMRLGEPGRLRDPHRPPHLMRLAFEFGREHRRRHQRRRQLDRFHHAVARHVAVETLQLERARREQHTAMAAIGGLVDQAGVEIIVEDGERAVPVALGAAEAEHGMGGPGRGRRDFQCLVRDHHRSDRVVGALRLDEQATQAEQPRVLALGHGTKRSVRALAVAVELRRLGVQQQRQRVAAGQPPRHVRMLAGGGGIAVADGQQAVGNGMAAARMAALASHALDSPGCAQDPAQDAPEQHPDDNGDAKRQRKHRKRGLHAPGAPGQGHLTGLFSHPCRTGSCQCERQQERRCGEGYHRLVCEMPGSGERGVTRIRLVEPSLRRGPIGRRKCLQFAPRLGEIVAQRCCRDPRDDCAAIVAGGVGPFDAHQLSRAGLQAVDDAGAGRGILRGRWRQLRYQRQQLAVEPGRARYTGRGEGLERLQCVSTGRQ